MRVLSLDTSGHNCGLAIVDFKDDIPQTLFHTSKPMARGHAATLPIQSAEAFECVPPSSINRVITTTGPGGFTGIRVGLAFAQAFALARSIPAIGLSTFAALRLTIGPSLPCLIDTRRGDYFYDTASARALGLKLPEEHDYGIVETAKLPRNASGLAGSILAVTTSDLSKLSQFEGLVEPDLCAMAKAALTLLPRDNPAKPLYVRSPSIG